MPYKGIYFLWASIYYSYRLFISTILPNRIYDLVVETLVTKIKAFFFCVIQKNISLSIPNYDVDHIAVESGLKK